MDILVYNQLDAGKVRSQFKRVSTMLAAGNFRGADVKKMQNTGLYRAKLNDTDRLLFKIGIYQGETVILLLEVILNHDYDHARFLRGKKVDESEFTPLDTPDKLDVKDLESLVYINKKQPHFHLLDRIISFDDHQLEAYGQRLPLILIGSAGSGKTVLLMEKIKEMRGDVLYITLSPYLADHARRLYYSLGYDNEKQRITFASFHDFLGMIRVPDGKPVHYNAFSAWYARYRQQYPFRNAHMLFEEFCGVITGSAVDQPCLSRDEYMALGVRRSIFDQSERSRVYDLFERYRDSLNENGFYDPNIMAWEYRSLCEPTYDCIAMDEIQDLTNAQIALVLSGLRTDSNFILCGDSNQIVHPNFFAWSSLKSMFYRKKAERPTEVFRVLNQNYRNALRVVETANQLLRIKVARFGSVDRESNYLVRCVSSRKGDVELLSDSASGNKLLDEKTHRSTRFAVIVLRDTDKVAARKYFQTPLVFSIQEAKGLEYENIILYNIVSGCRKEFEEITQGIAVDDLQGDLDYARAKDKTDKSLEIYKFYINALYVGLTRAVDRVFLVESDTQHRLFSLLHLNVRKQAGQIKSESSTDDEWREEASRLEKKGNIEQAEQIRKQVLKLQPVPWTVWTVDNLSELKKQALDPASFNKKAKQQLYEYALIYGDRSTLQELVDFKFTRAGKETNPAVVERDYARDCFTKDFKDVRQKVKLYGVDYRNPLNKTSLMVAALIGRMDVVEWLINEGASIDATDNTWQSCFWQIIFRHLQERGMMSENDFETALQWLTPECLNIQIDRKLKRLEKHQYEFWMLVIFIYKMAKTAHIPLTNSVGRYYADHYFTSKNLADFSSLIPDNFMPAHRKQRKYCSAALSKNEYHNHDLPYNRKIVSRIKTGYYMINPMIKLLINDQWISVSDLIHSEFSQHLKYTEECWKNPTGIAPKPSRQTKQKKKSTKKKTKLKSIKDWYK